MPETVSEDWIVQSGVDDNAESTGPALTDAPVLLPYVLPEAEAAHDRSIPGRLLEAPTRPGSCHILALVRLT